MIEDKYQMSVLDIFQSLEPFQKRKELAFHGVRSEEEYVLYVKYFKPMRFTREMNTKLSIVTISLSGQFAAILGDILPFNHSLLIANIPRHLEQFGRYTFAPTIVQIDKSDIGKCLAVLDEDLSDYKERLLMLENCYLVNSFIRLTSQDSSTILNFRSIAPRSFTPSFSDRVLEHSLDHGASLQLSDMQLLREHKIIVTYNINEREFWYQIAVSGIRDDLTNAEVLYILCDYIIKFPGKTLKETKLLLICGFEPHRYSFDNYFAKRTTFLRSLGKTEYDIICKLYHNQHPETLFELKSEGQVLIWYRQLGMKGLFLKVGGVIPMHIETKTNQDQNEMKSTIGSSAEYFYCRDQLSQAFGMYLDGKTFKRLMTEGGVKTIDFNDLQGLLTKLEIANHYPTCFIPIEPQGRNSVSFTTGDPIGQNPYFAYGTLNDYINYDLGDLETVCGVNEDGTYTPFKPNDVKNEFDLKELNDMQLFIRRCMPEHKKLATAIDAVVRYLGSDAALGLHKLQTSQIVPFGQKLCQIVNMGFYMRQWKGPGHPYPLKAKDTGVGDKKSTEKIEELLRPHYINFKADLLPEFQKILKRLRVEAMAFGDPSNIWDLLEATVNDKYCIRMGSRKLIIASSKIIEKLGGRLDFKLEDVDSIS